MPTDKVTPKDVIRKATEGTFQSKFAEDIVGVFRFVYS
jgi:hypothetical protein